MNSHKSDTLFDRAKSVIPGGVNSPVRAYKSVGRNPLFITKASGSKIWDADGNAFIDYVGSWGPMILGHAHHRVIEAIRKAALDGTSYGAPTEYEVRMAELICKIFPSIDMVRMVNSGTEATMSAVRLARAFTGREKIIKFEGCYHGHGDAFLIKAGSGAMTFSVPDSPGVPAGVAEGTLTATFNDLASVQALLDKHRNSVAAVIVEPVVGNMGCIPPETGFLQGLQSACTKAGTLLIFDEVMTGFRVALGGAQELYGIKPDLTTLGKIIGGGLPVGAYGGRRDIMEMVAPQGPMYQAGTLSGNPLAMVAGLETLSAIMDDPKFYSRLEAKAARLTSGLQKVIDALWLPLKQNRVGSMFTLFFAKQPVRDYATAAASDREKFGIFFREMLERGIALAPSQFEAGFVSIAHSDEDIDKTIEAARQSLAMIYR
ncbi:MAG: glutamate-1-semialdehyde 2,1-aminomutase [Bacteroidetes bacterium]|nr:glutamate-1-semialdehyde 2,1-aminomutase [Bacteroidota bacterium]